MLRLSHRRTRAAWLALVVLLLLLSALACDLPGVPVETPPPVPVPVTPLVVTAGAPEEPVSPPEEEPVSPPAADVSYEGISFSFDDTLAAGVSAETVPAEPYMDGENVTPQHVEFLFTGYALANTFHQPRLYVYPVADFEASSQIGADVIAAQRQFLAEKPAVPPQAAFVSQGIPFLPIFNAGQMMRAGVAYLDFQNGTGVRFLTQYAQAYLPINNNELFYTFQGMTDDGAYYVAAVLPVSNPVLPADNSAIPGGDFEAFANNFETYIQDVEGQLNAQAPDSFTPGLPVLDAMIQSLQVQ